MFRAGNSRRWAFFKANPSWSTWTTPASLSRTTSSDPPPPPRRCLLGDVRGYGRGRRPARGPCRANQRGGEVRAQDLLQTEGSQGKKEAASGLLDTCPVASIV